MSPKRCGGFLRLAAFAGIGRTEAGNDSTFVGSSLPRQRRLSARMAESSVSTIASSPSVVDAMAAAAAIVRRSKALMPRCAFHSGESTMMSIARTMGAFGDEVRLGFVRGRALIPSLACGKNKFGCDSFLQLARTRGPEHGVVVGFHDALHEFVPDDVGGGENHVTA